MFKIKKYFLIFILILVPFSPTYSQESVELNGYQEWTEDKIISDWIYVAEDATLFIKKGVNLTFQGDSGIEVAGKLIIKGTVKDPVKIKREDDDSSYSFQIDSTGQAEIKNTYFNGGGLLAPPCNPNLDFCFNQDTGAIHLWGGKLDVEGSTFQDNTIAIFIDNIESSSDVKVNRSKFISNSKYDVKNNSTTGEELDFRYNWWGDFSGPEIDDSGNSYKYIIGDVNVSDWAQVESFHDPVIIIPGILGSQERDGQWHIDLILHTYDNLYNEFAANQYVPEKDLYTFPYEWRDSNVENAKLLRDKINEIKAKEHWPKVDIVGHSMGGLLAREYIESDYYQNDVDQLVTLGTPHLGAPEAYLKWDGDGWFFLSPSDMILKHIFQQEAEESGYSDIFDYVHQRPIFSLQELLPVYDYLQDVKNGYEYKNYPNGYPRNEFLESLNSDNRKTKLYDVEFSKIIGRTGENTSTISGFKVIVADLGKWWKHGYPHGFEIPIGDQGLIHDDGDGTVPLVSAKSVDIFFDQEIVLMSSHRALPTDAQKDILELLTAKRPETEKREPLVKHILFVSVYSPIDIQIISPSDQRVGKDFETGEIINEIEGAYYTGYETENEFLTIPNPEDGEYKILTEGTGEGEYKIKATKIAEGESQSYGAIESTVEINGVAEPEKQEELKIEIDGNEVTSEDQDTTPPIITGSVTTEPNANGWHDNDVIIHFEATDESGIAEITPDITLTEEGKNQEVVGTATDIFGNSASFIVSGVNIDKTAPEAKLTFNEEEQKLDIIGLDNLSPNVSVEIKEETVEEAFFSSKKKKFSWVFSMPKKEKKKQIFVTTTLTDEAGHKTEVVYEKKKDKNRRIDIALESISYDGMKTDFSKSRLQYKWLLNWRKNKYVLFGTHIRNDNEMLEAHYRSKRNETWIMERPQELDDDDNDDDIEKRLTWKKLSGLVIPFIQTEKGNIKVDY